MSSNPFPSLENLSTIHGSFEALIPFLLVVSTVQEDFIDVGSFLVKRKRSKKGELHDPITIESSLKSGFSTMIVRPDHTSKPSH